MMDLKEIIKWFIPCFHVLLARRVNKMDSRLTFVFLFLLFNLCSSFAAIVNSSSDYRLKNSLLNNAKNKDVGFSNVSFVSKHSEDEAVYDENRSFEESTDVHEVAVGRTFGPRIKKMVQALIPLAFQMGMAATWAVVAALVGIKTLGVSLLILKLLLLAGAFKFGSFFAQKSHGYNHGHGWEPPHSPNKEIHLHIHNGQHGTEEHVPLSPWSREGVQTPDGKPVNPVFDPYGAAAGPQTVSTPYGQYMKIDPQQYHNNS